MATNKKPDPSFAPDPRLEKLKILFCPHEIGGQMQLMVEELRRRGYYATAASYGQEWFGYVNDITLNLDKRRGKLGRHFTALSFTAWAASNYDIFHFFWGESMFGTRWFPQLDLPLLRALGKKIFVHFRGLDVIDLEFFDYLRERHFDENLTPPPLSRPEQLRRLERWRRYSDRMLVSEPDLFRVVPDAVMVQQAIDMERWSSSGRPPQSVDDGIIRIAHAPSMRRKKGTEFVEEAVAALKAEGLSVELVLIEKMPFHQVKEHYELCDIGIDQILYGWYGKVSAEIMAMERPVICYVEDELRPYRSDMPIVSATTKTLTDELRQLVTDSKLRRQLGKRGAEYVHKHHDVRGIIDQCLELYGNSLD